MSKWRVVRGINSTKYDAIIDAGCRYMNSKSFPVLGELAAIIGLEEIEEEELCSEQVTEMEDGE